MFYTNLDILPKPPADKAAELIAHLELVELKQRFLQLHHKTAALLAYYTQLQVTRQNIRLFGTGPELNQLCNKDGQLTRLLGKEDDSAFLETSSAEEADAVLAQEADNIIVRFFSWIWEKLKAFGRWIAGFFKAKDKQLSNNKEDLKKAEEGDKKEAAFVANMQQGKSSTTDCLKSFADFKKEMEDLETKFDMSMKKSAEKVAPIREIIEEIGTITETVQESKGTPTEKAQLGKAAQGVVAVLAKKKEVMASYASVPISYAEAEQYIQSLDDADVNLLNLYTRLGGAKTIDEGRNVLVQTVDRISAKCLFVSSKLSAKLKNTTSSAPMSAWSLEDAKKLLVLLENIGKAMHTAGKGRSPLPLITAIGGFKSPKVFHNKKVGTGEDPSEVIYGSILGYFEIPNLRSFCRLEETANITRWARKEKCYLVKDAYVPGTGHADVIVGAWTKWVPADTPEASAVALSSVRTTLEKSNICCCIQTGFACSTCPVADTCFFKMHPIGYMGSLGDLIGIYTRDRPETIAALLQILQKVSIAKQLEPKLGR